MLHTHLGELLCTREHKEGLSKKKKKSCVYMDIDGLKMCSASDDESIFKPKKEYIDIQDKMDAKIYSINDLIKIIKKINYKLEKNVSYINSYINSKLLFLVDDSEMIYKLNAKIDDTLNFVLNEI